MLNKKKKIFDKNYADIKFNEALKKNPKLAKIIKALEILTEVKKKIKKDYGTDDLTVLCKMLTTKVNNLYITKETYENATIIITEYNRLREECKNLLIKYR